MKKTKEIKKCLIKIKYWTKKLILILFASLTSCGSTKAVISKPAEGTSTTITITTNNPITTNVEPEIKYNND